MFPPLQVSVEEASVELSPIVPVTVAVSKLGVAVVDVALVEQKRGVNGKVISERSIPVRLVPAASHPLGYWSELRLRQADGTNPLDYDGLYQLRLSVTMREPAFPLPREVVVTQLFPFQTLTTPQLRTPQGLVELEYRKPLRLQWNSPVRRFDVELEPKAELRTWIDPVHPEVGYVDLDKAEPGRLYRVQVVGAEGVNGAPLVAHAALTVETAAAPRPVDDSVKVEDGDRVVIWWDRPLKGLDYQIEPAIDSTLVIDPEDPRVSHLLLRDPRQQHEYRVRVLGGTALTGAPIEETREFTVVTPPALDVSEAGPPDGAFGVSLQAPIVIAFSDEVRNRAAAEAAVTITPMVSGRFEWPKPNRLRFVPAERLPELTDIKVMVKAGPSGVRGVAGGYLEEPLEFSFRTRPDKLIEVDLTKQQLILFERDRPVFTTRVATGVRGAETPTGEFTVNFKVPALRMRGVNPDGSRYDIPNVPWVMSFLGDYTLHGAPWRVYFGSPQSNGCVSMETGAAKRVYDWTPVGTPVKIHY